MNELLDDYAALKGLAPAARQLLDILGIVERGLTLKAEIPALEKKKAALADAISALKAESAVARAAATAEATQIQQGLGELRSQHVQESQRLETDKRARLEQDIAERERLQKDHEAMALGLAARRAAVESEITMLERRKAELTKSLKDLVAAVPTG
jgi:chromosome segregation ATPase